MTITKSHTGNFIPDRPAAYTITVGNNATAPTDGTTVTLHDTLPTSAIVIAGNASKRAATLSRSSPLGTALELPFGLPAAPSLPGRVSRKASMTPRGQ
ncbi:hypothetical protein [Streptomyces sp. NPDC054794]